MMKKGAEANVKIKDKKVVKNRKPKEYRHKEIDQQIRKERTKEEIKLTKEAKKHNVNTPEILSNEDTSIEFEKIEGNLLKDVINDETKKMEEVGKNIAFLHSANIIHGDITTSNIIINEKPYLIDFGLSYRSERNEDKAVDLHLLKQVLESSHPEIKDKAWKLFKKGYQNYEDSEKIFEQLEEVENRGRYK
ncbi:MAG: KEOPS complex kinase/ATPase Bud32 [Candidatus Nanohaloarchaea archaeon]